MEVITYEALYELLRQEKVSRELQKLDSKFYSLTIHYLREKTAILQSQQKKESIFSSVELQKTRKQLDNIYKILTDLYDLREKKIMELAVFSSRSKDNMISDNLSKEEKHMFSELKTLFDSFRSSILYALLNSRIPVVEKTKDIKAGYFQSGNKLVRFIKTIPKFVAEDLNTYGPYENEDLANLPAKTADLLIKTEKAVEI